MKLTFLLIVLATLQVSAKTYSQKISVNFSNTKLADALKQIEHKSDYRFVFSNKVLNEKLAVSFSANDISVDELLKAMLANTGLKDSLLDNKLIVIKQISGFDEIVKVSGTVTDSAGGPVEGASIIVKGKKAGTTTDANGNFSITVDEDATLEISSVGYSVQNIHVNGKSLINIVLQKADASLTDVVVVGYGSQKKVNLTGAVSTVSGAVLEDRPIPNVGRGLMGQLPGLNITSSDGRPGRGTSFNIRGFTSINGGSPLILVDGVPTDINNINPDDVASATVLKDAASAAVYGSRAPFGVILITTKSGKKGKPVIRYSGNVAIHKIANLPDVVTDPATVVDFKNQAYSGYYGVNLYNSQIVDYANQRSADPSLPATIVDPNNPNNYVYVGNTNWFDELYAKTNVNQIHNLSISGGGDRFTYFVSGDFNEQTGIYRYNPDNYERYNLRVKLSFNVNKWLEIHSNSAYNRTVYEYPSLWTSDWTSGDLYHQIGRLNTMSTVKNPDGSWTSAGVYIGFLQDGGRGTTTTNQMQNGLGFTASFLDNSLRIKGDYTFRSTDNYNQQYRVSLPYETGPTELMYYAGRSEASAWSDNNNYTNLDLYAEYEKTFGKLHYFKAQVGYNQQLNKYDYFSSQNYNLISSNVGYLDATTGTTPLVEGNGYEWAIRGLFYRLNYIFDNKYLIEFNGRYDGSSRFPPDNHYGFFPSFSAGWRVSEEGFFRGIKSVVNNLKFRASYGSLGNDQSLGNYSFIPTLATSQVGNILGGLQPIAVYPAGLVSPDLTWEKVYSKNIGVDFTFFKNFSGSFDYYIRDTKDMITKGFQLPAVLGAAQPLENAADLRTKGWELNLNYHNQFRLAGKPFDFNIIANVWDNQTTITHYNNPNKYWFGGDYYEGQHVGDIWGLTTKGIFQTDEEANKAPDQSQVIGYYGQQAGEIQYADLNGDGKIDYGEGTVGNPGDAHIIGNSTPRYSYGLGANFTWNGFDFSIFFQGVGKRDYWPGTSGYYWSMFFAPWENVYQNIVGTTWTTDNPHSFYPSLKGWRAGDAGNWLDLAVPQSRYMFNAAYIRLKNLTIGYTLPFKGLKNIGIERVRIYASGEDLWESTKLPQGFDPEGLGGSWGTGKIYPFQRSYSFGLDVQF